jgi:hypothetical protein
MNARKEMMLCFYLRADNCLLSIAVMVTTPVCADRVPYWLGMSENNSHWLLFWSKVTVRHCASFIQASWQFLKLDTKTRVEGEQPELLHWYLILVVIDKVSDRMSWETDCVIMVNRNNNFMFVMSRKNSN